MLNLAILITGQIRDFFSNNYFTEVLERCIEKYDKVLVICVLNPSSEDDDELLKKYFSNYKIFELLIIDFSNKIYKNDYSTKMKIKYNNKIFDIIYDKYKNLNTQGFVEIPDPKTTKNNIILQFYQLYIGMSTLRQYQEDKNINFDITWRTRFDLFYPNDFYPHLPKSDDIFDILCFNQKNKKLLLEVMNKYCMKSIDDIITYNKENVVRPPHCRILNKDHWYISFGSEYVSNYKSLEYIKSGNYNIIYSFGHQFEFGETKNMLIFEKLFDYFWINEPIDPNIYTHYYAPENQIMQFCLDNNLPILCYRDYCLTRFKHLNL